MSESFNLKNAKSLEAEYKSTWNFRGLADINIEFCEKIGSAHIYEDRLPRVFFYLGRLKGLEEIKLFIERNQSLDTSSLMDQQNRLQLLCRFW